MQPYNTREELKHKDVLSPEKRKPSHQPASAHPWRNQAQGDTDIHTSSEIEETAPKLTSSMSPKAALCTPSSMSFERRKRLEAGIDPPDYDERFDRKYGEVKHLVKDGRPLTERGAELLAWHRAGRWYRTAAPLQVVVSPSQNPPHSQQTKQVHQYQQKQGRS